ncbi:MULTISPECIES: chemotaxis protein CheW [Natrinema]|uniref:CheW domain protein n=1 Tax=Natrinema gari JCM 14663 TaxID=1230459 RepID=L9YNJ0_9EURY|nr:MULTISPECIES: chemotaxis protein CheW [Natrinema]AFO58750.1 CheW domain protein [Natrinema sp. J7-2]ELY75246.1 CheW domain protein [Natrinema gari JCM 14663]
MESVSTERTERDERVTVLTFTLEEKRYCVAAASITSVLGVTDDDPLVDADDPWHAGTIHVAGERIRVVDLPRVFGSSFETVARVDHPKLLVFSATDGNDHNYGWLIDGVGVTRDVPTASLEPPRIQTRHVKGQLEIDERDVIWLDEQAIHG